LAPVLARHGLKLRQDVLDDPRASIMDGLGLAPKPTDTTARLRVALDDVDALIRKRRGGNRRRTATTRK
jgi:hypothetical protein